MIHLGSRVLYSKQSGFPCGTFCFCGTVEEIKTIEIIKGVEQERYLVVGSLGERVLARRDELTERKEKKHGTNRNKLSNGQEDMGFLSRMSA